MKMNMLFKMYALLFVCVTLLGLCGCAKPTEPPPAPTTITLKITNNTGGDIPTYSGYGGGLYIRRAGTSSWTNINIGSTLLNGNVRSIELSSSYVPGNYDIEVRTTSDHRFREMNVSLVNGDNNLTFSGTNASNIVITFTNNTGGEIPTYSAYGGGLYVRVGGTSSWDNINIGSSLPSGSFRTIALSSSYLPGLHDIEVRTTADQRFRKTSFNLSNGINTMTFSSTDASNIVLTFTNNTGGEIPTYSGYGGGLYVRVAGTSSWDNINIGSSLPNGSFRTIALSSSYLPGLHDIEVRTTADHRFRKSSINLSNGVNTMTFSSADASNIVLTITNNTGYEIPSYSGYGGGLYIKVSSSSSWTNINLGSSLPSGSFRIVALSTSFVPGSHDIEVRTVSGGTFRKTSVSLVSGSSNSFTFTPADGI